MSVASIFIVFFLLLLIVWDWAFLPKTANRARILMNLTFGIIALISFFPERITQVANHIGIGRGADLVFYFGFILLIRELFLARARQNALEGQITQLVRATAIQNAVKELTSSADGPDADSFDAGRSC